MADIYPRAMSYSNNCDSRGFLHLDGSSTVSVLAHPVHNAIPHGLLTVDRSMPPGISLAEGKRGKAHPDKV
jgi:hypothetical protein